MTGELAMYKYVLYIEYCTAPPHSHGRNSLEVSQAAVPSVIYSIHCMRHYMRLISLLLIYALSGLAHLSVFTLDSTIPPI